MKAIVNTGPGRLEWIETPMPAPGTGQALVKTACCGICATDLEMIAGWERTGFPSVPGHEWSGSVAGVGPGVDRDIIGRMCAGDNALAAGGEIGFEHPGGYAEFFLTDASNLHFLPAGFDMRVAALAEPLAVCVRAMRRLNASDKRSAAVVGDGPIGLLMVMLLKHHGFNNIAVAGGRRERLNLALEFGAAAAVNYHETGDNLAKTLSNAAGGECRNVIEASGSEKGAEAALACAAKDAHILIVGDYGKAKAGFPWNTLLHRELVIIGSNSSAGAWKEAVAMATKGMLPMQKMISACYPAHEFQQAIEAVRTRRDSVKIILDWQ